MLSNIFGRIDSSLWSAFSSLIINIFCEFAHRFDLWSNVSWKSHCDAFIISHCAKLSCVKYTSYYWHREDFSSVFSWNTDFLFSVSQQFSDSESSCLQENLFEDTSIDFLKESCSYLYIWLSLWQLCELVFCDLYFFDLHSLHLTAI